MHIRVADHVIWATALERFATSDSKSKFRQSRSEFRSRCRSESEDGSGPAHPASRGRHQVGSNPRHTANGRCSRSQGHAIPQTDADKVPAGDYCEGQREGRRQRRCGRIWQGLIVANIGTRDLLRARDGGEKVGKGYEHTLSVWCGRDRVEVPAWRLRYARCTMMDARCQRGGSLRARHDGDSSSGYAMRQLQLSLLFEPCRVMLLAQTRALCRATGNVDIHGHKHL
jgi:hypothetical protein